MSPNIRISNRQLLCLAVLGCWAMLGVLTNEAEATCGDYLQHGSLSHRLAATGSATAANSTELQQVWTTSGLPGKIKTCNGPNCQQSPAELPLPAPQRVVLLPAGDAIVAGSTEQPIAINMSWVVISCDHVHGSFTALRLLRPPRFTA